MPASMPVNLPRNSEPRTDGDLLEKVVSLLVAAERRRGVGGQGGGGPEGDVSGELQKELTQLYKMKAQNDQQLIETNNRLQQRDHEVATMKNQNEQNQLLISTYRNNIRALEEDMHEQKTTYQLLYDEHVALQATYSGLEAKYRKLEGEMEELLTRWKGIKEEQVEKMNQQVEEINKLQRLKLQRELQAAGSSKNVPIFDPDKDGLEDYDVETERAFGISFVPTRCKFKFEAHTNEINAVQWTPSGKKFVTGGADRKVKVWELSDNRAECKATLTGSNQAVTSLDFDSTEKQVLATCNDYAIRFWSMENQRLLQSFTGHSDKVMSAKFHSGDSQVVSGSHDCTVKLWDLRSRRCIQTLFAGSRCNDLITTQDRGIFSGHNDKKVKCWDTRSRESAFEILLPGKVTSLDMSLCDTQYLLCCTRNDSLHLIDLRTNGIIHNYCAESFRVPFDYSRAVLSSDMQFASAGSSDGRLFVWNIRSTKVEGVLHKGGHE